MVSPALAAAYAPSTVASGGNNSPVEVSVVGDDAITEITVTAHSETPGIGSRPISDLPA